MNFLDMLARDRNVSPALRSVLSLQYAKAQFRRFDDEAQHSAFGAHDYTALVRDIREADAPEGRNGSAS